MGRYTRIRKVGVGIGEIACARSISPNNTSNRLTVFVVLTRALRFNFDERSTAPPDDRRCTKICLHRRLQIRLETLITYILNWLPPMTLTNGN